MRHLTIAAATLVASSPILFAAEAGGTGGKQADLLKAAEPLSAELLASLPPEVLAQLEAAVTNLEAARARILELDSELSAANAEGDDLAAEVKSLTEQLADVKAAAEAEFGRIRAASEKEVTRLSRALEKAEADLAKAKSKAPPAAAKVVETGKVEVTVLRGTVRHGRGERDICGVGETYTTRATPEALEELADKRDRGVLSFVTA